MDSVKPRFGEKNVEGQILGMRKKETAAELERWGCPGEKTVLGKCSISMINCRGFRKC